MKGPKAILSLIIAAAVFYGFHFPHGKLPPIGDFFNPFVGFWQNGARVDAIPGEEQLAGIGEPVTILFDDRMVPHIFAANDHDLYFAQGYLTAKYRLWQMEVQTHAAAGRLAEILGQEALPADRFMRRIGLTYAAENSLQAIGKIPPLQSILTAYCDGVNAYIGSLKKKEDPIEYKLLNYRPEKWSPLKCMLLLKYMAWDLTSNNADRLMTQAAAIFDPAKMKALYPLQPPLSEPVIPSGTRWSFKTVALTPARKKIDVPGFFLPDDNGKIRRSSLKSESPRAGGYRSDQDSVIENESNRSVSVAGRTFAHRDDHYLAGSNNWAVAGSKTQNGHPILCNDPHLTLQLPAIWYEIQLSSPSQNVYGVSLPGAPFVIIGFTNDLAWGCTNAYSDVLDWYAIRFADERCEQYWYAGAWRPTQKHIEEIKVRHAATVWDTVVYTHHGPVVCRPNEQPLHRDVPIAAAMRWLGHDSTREAYTFYLLNRAKDYQDFVAALSYYECPAQNFAYADRAGNIAIWHNGRFPLRRREQGRFILDGSNPENDWQGWVPHAHNPQVLNPAQGFVASANQKPTDDSYPYYLGWDYASFDRSARIAQLLRSVHAANLADMAAMQLDDYSIFAQHFLTWALPYLPTDGWSEAEKQAIAMLRDWDGRYRQDAIAATIFYYWREALIKAVVDDDLATPSGRLKTPRSEVILHLLFHEPDASLIDDSRTPQRETLSDVLSSSLRAALEQLTAQFGQMGDAWRWGAVRHIDIQHLGRIPGFGRMNLSSNGHHDTINAIGKRHGPSWRMVVELGEKITALGIYPGGQSGHPGSKYYDDMVEDWLAGKYDSLIFLQDVHQAHERIIAQTLLRGR